MFYVKLKVVKTACDLARNKWSKVDLLLLWFYWRVCCLSVTPWITSLW